LAHHHPVADFRGLDVRPGRADDPHALVTEDARQWERIVLVAAGEVRMADADRPNLDDQLIGAWIV
jgi:hypothetical protein